ncbi:MAG: CHAT domain-containing protein [Cyanobacteria bacterium P01_A01_bin.135]
MTDLPCLSLAVNQLSEGQARRYVAWVLNAPYAGGYMLHERAWPNELSHLWHLWQTMFSRTPPPLPEGGQPRFDLGPPAPGQPTSLSTRLMQQLGMRLWHWLFEDAIGTSLNMSQGIALGQQRSLRLRLEVRDPSLLPLPWEIMQASAGQRAISLGAELRFSRSISEVEPLPPLRQSTELQTLLVEGQPHLEHAIAAKLDLSQERQVLLQALQGSAGASNHRVTCLIQPTPAELMAHLDEAPYNLFIYSGHGVPGPDGGRLFLGPGAELNGMELAQALTHRQVKLAVFNACWGAQADRSPDGRAIPRSSLAEVLICQGVPAVLAMRDAIADGEATSFIQAFSEALASHGSIERAVAEARQRLLTLYKFNQPAWTLPVLYMHPEFDGQLLQISPIQEDGTEIPNAPATWINQTTPTAALRTLTSPAEYWPIQGGMLRVGKDSGNDLVIRGPGVSRRHAEIFYRSALTGPVQTSSYYLKDFSRFGTFIHHKDGWRCVRNQEVPLAPNMQVKFGSDQNQLLEFIVDGEGA